MRFLRCAARGSAAALACLLVAALAAPATAERAPATPADLSSPSTGASPATEGGISSASAVLSEAIPAAGDVTADPVGAARREIEASCLRVGYPEAFGRWTDLNADGDDDVIFTFDVVCDGFSGAFCGREGCAGAVFVAAGEGRFRRTSLPPQAVPRDPIRGRPAVTVAGSSEPIRVWNGVDFVPPNQLARGRAVAAAAPEAPVSDPNDHHATAALFDDRRRRRARLAAMSPSQASAEAAAEARIEALAVSGALAAAPPIRPIDPDAVWAYAPRGRGRAEARIAGWDGFSTFALACRAGDGDVGVAATADRGVLAAPALDGDVAFVEVFLGGRTRGRLRLVYAEAEDIWVTRFDPAGEVSEWLRRGSSVSLVEAEEEGAAMAARFTLDGSRRAIEAMYRACGVL